MSHAFAMPPSRKKPRGTKPPATTNSPEVQPTMVPPQPGALPRDGRICPRCHEDAMLLWEDGRTWECPLCHYREIAESLPPPREKAPRSLSRKLLEMEVDDCDCPLLVPLCQLDGSQGCRQRQEENWCDCELSPCRHILALKPHDVPISQWGQWLEAELPTHGKNDHDGYHESAEPLETTDTRPGSPERMQVLRDRLKRGESCSRPGDAYFPGSLLSGLYSRLSDCRHIPLEDAPPQRDTVQSAEALRQQILAEARAHGQKVAEQLQRRKQGGSHEQEQ